MSIRRQLLVGLLSSVLVAGVLAACVVFFQARAEVSRLFDDQLRQIAYALRDRSFLPGQLDQVLQGEEARDIVVQVWGSDGVRLYASDPAAPAPEALRLGFDTYDSGTGSWRGFGIVQRGLMFLVAQPLAVREHLALAASARTLLPFLVALPLMGLLIWSIVGRELRVLEVTTRAVEERNSDALDPVDAAAAPEEVRSLIEALNGLMARLAEALARERRFVADAAHELRTPLTALRLQLQVAERAVEAPERAAAHADLREGIQRASRLVEQLLTMARQDPDAPVAAESRVDLASVARDVIHERSVIAASRAIALAAGPLEDVEVAGEAHSLRTLAENLVDNALRYTPRGGHVTVSARRDGATTKFEVEDDGPGIPAGERHRVFDRFYRGARADGEGAGLGLAIVQRIAERHGAHVELAERAGSPGLRATVAFPDPPAGTATLSPA